MSVRRIAAVFATLLLAACGSGSGDTIVIGVTGPFSVARGVSMKAGAELARDEINAAGGIGGRKIELIFEDDSANADAAVRIANRFRNDKRVVAVIGHLTSGPTAAAAPIYNGDGHPMALISPSASAPSLTEDGGRAVFRICPTDFAHGQALARYARNVLHAGSAEVLYENDTYGRGVSANFVADFHQLGGRVVGTDPYNKSIASFEPYLRRLQQRGGADAILIAGTLDGAVRVLATRDTLKITSAVLAGDGVVGIEATGRAEGMFVSSAWLADQPDSASRKFVAAYAAAKNGAVPDHRGAGALGTDREKIVGYLEGVGTATKPYDGVTGRIIFDQNGDAKDKAVAVGVVRHMVMMTAGQ